MSLLLPLFRHWCAAYAPCGRSYPIQPNFGLPACPDYRRESRQNRIFPASGREYFEGVGH